VARVKKGLFASVLALMLIAAAPAHATLSWNTPTFDFGQQEVGNASPATTFVLTATCDQVMLGACTMPALGEHPVGGVTAPGDEFGVETTDCPPLLLTPLGGSIACTARATFKPSSKGLKTGTLTTSFGTLVALSGTGVLEGSGKNGDGSGGKKCKKKKKKKSNSATAAKKKKKCKKKKKKGK
jgi:hypothetical protein